MMSGGKNCVCVIVVGERKCRCLHDKSRKEEEENSFINFSRFSYDDDGNGIADHH